MTLRIAIAPNAFRGSLTAFEVAECIQTGLNQSNLLCETRLMPLADGGDGTLDVWLQANDNSEIIYCDVKDPLGREIKSKFGLSGDTALIEMAHASGMNSLNPKKRIP